MLERDVFTAIGDPAAHGQVRTLGRRACGAGGIDSYEMRRYSLATEDVIVVVFGHENEQQRTIRSTSLQLLAAPRQCQATVPGATVVSRGCA